MEGQSTYPTAPAVEYLEVVGYPDVEGSAGQKFAPQGRATPIPTAPPIPITFDDDRSPLHNHAESSVEQTTDTLVMKITDLGLRISCVVLSVISLSVISSDDSKENDYNYVVASLSFTHFGSYDYLVAASVVAIVYSLPQAVVAGLRLCIAASCLESLFYICFSIAIDTISSIVLATASSAALAGAMVMDEHVPQSFVSKAYGAASVMLLAFLVELASIVVSVCRLFSKLQHGNHVETL